MSTFPYFIDVVSVSLLPSSHYPLPSFLACILIYISICWCFDWNQSSDVINVMIMIYVIHVMPKKNIILMILPISSQRLSHVLRMMVLRMHLHQQSFYRRNSVVLYHKYRRHIVTRSFVCFFSTRD
jgi:hypothetical protein